MYKILRPNYFEKFKCVGGSCEDTCCKGWKINIDRKTYKKYMKCKNIGMRKKLEKNISRNRNAKSDYDYASFKSINKDCPFLNDDNLCDIYIKLGEESMCNTCRIYPRTYNYVNGIIQEGLTLSCIEAARLVLMNKDIMEFDLIEDKSLPRAFSTIIKSNGSSKILEKNFEEIREFSIDIIQNRKFSIEERLIILGLFCKEIDANYKKENSIDNIISKYNHYINEGYYENLLNKINIEKTIEAQFSLLILLSKNIVFNKFIIYQKYLEILHQMIEGLKLNNSSINEAKTNFIENYSKNYKNFIMNKEYIYENYLVNYIFNKLFPYDFKDDIINSYANLTINFLMIKLNAIGLCAYHKDQMDENKLLELIQAYSRAMLHDSSLNFKIYEYLKENDMNTINHMILMIGK